MGCADGSLKEALFGFLVAELRAWCVTGMLSPRSAGSGTLWMLLDSINGCHPIVIVVSQARSVLVILADDGSFLVADLSNHRIRPLTITMVAMAIELAIASLAQDAYPRPWKCKPSQAPGPKVTWTLHGPPRHLSRQLQNSEVLAAAEVRKMDQPSPRASPLHVL